MNSNLITRTVLIVEDEAIISIVTAKTVKSFGYEVNCVSSGEKAVEYIVSGNPVNLILMDIDLGAGIDGTEAARRILDIKNIPIVFHTAHSEQDMVERVKGLTRYGYVIKSSGDFVLNSSIEMAFELFEAHRNIETAMGVVKESEEKYRAAFMMSPDAVNINAMDGRYVDINEGFTMLTGFTRDDVIGRVSTDLNIWSSADDRQRLVNELSTKGSADNMEFVFGCKDGSTKTALMSARIIKINNEPHILSITRDISGQKEYEEQIKTRSDELTAINEELVAAIEELESTNEEFEVINEEFYETNMELMKKEDALRLEQFFTNSLIDSLPGIFYLYSYPDLRLIRWNKNHELMFGFESQEIRGRHIVEWFQPDYRDAVLRKVEAIMKGDHGLGELHIMKKDGSTLPMLMTGVRFESDGESFLMGSGFDISERKIIEDALQESEERYRTLVETLPDGVVIHYRGKIYYANGGANRILRAECPGQLTGLPVSDFIHPCDSGQKSEIPCLKKSGKKKASRCESEFIRFDGKTIKVSRTDIPFRYSGKPAILTIFNDISERREAEIKINALLAEKELLLKEVHHRIKNNMNTIKGLLALQSYTLKEPLAVNALQDAENRVQCMMVLYDKLYTSNDFRELSLKEYLPALVDEIAANYLIHDLIKVEAYVEDFVINTKILFPLGIIVNELITNAMKYAFVGRDNGLITLSACLDNGDAEIIISDNGIGVPENIEIDKSSGFGLQLAWMLVEQIGGSIRLERDNGTKFVIKFSIK